MIEINQNSGYFRYLSKKANKEIFIKRKIQEIALIPIFELLTVTAPLRYLSGQASLSHSTATYKFDFTRTDNKGYKYRRISSYYRDYLSVYSDFYYMVTRKKSIQSLTGKYNYYD